MRKAGFLVSLSLAVCLVSVPNAFAGIIGAPEIDPASLSGGIALVMTSAALIIERRRRR